MVLLIPLQLKAQDPPDIPDLIRVTVDHSDNGVLIQWEPSMDNDIEFYHLYKMNAQQSFVLLFTFDPYTFEYKHMTSGLKNLAYAVTAEDSTGNESLFGQNVHRAVSVSSDFDLCELSNEVQWTGYEGWEGDISGYKLYGALAGDAFLLLDFVQASTTSFTHIQVEVDTTYVYYVETIHKSGITSNSSIDSVTSIFPEAPSYITVDYISVIDESNIELQFSADINGPVKSFRVMRRNCAGVRAIKLADGDELAALLPVPGGGSSERRAIAAAAASSSSGSRDLLVGTATGVMLRLAQADIPASSRAAKGVGVVRLGQGDTVATVTAMSGEGEGETDDEEEGGVGGGVVSSSSAGGRSGGGGNGVARKRSSSSPSKSSTAAATAAAAAPAGRKTSYMNFCDSLRERVRAELLEGAGGGGVVKMTDVSKELGRRWRELSEAEKAKYKQ